MLKLKWQQINIMCYNNESHSVYDEDIENKRKMLSLIIKKYGTFPYKKIIITTNRESKQVEIAKIS